MYLLVYVLICKQMSVVPERSPDDTGDDMLCVDGCLAFLAAGPLDSDWDSLVAFERFTEYVVGIDPCALVALKWAPASDDPLCPENDGPSGCVVVVFDSPVGVSYPPGLDFVPVSGVVRPGDVESLRRGVVRFLEGKAGTEGHGDWTSVWGTLAGLAAPSARA